jgi:hypothetical protein
MIDLSELGVDVKGLKIKEPPFQLLGNLIAFVLALQLGENALLEGIEYGLH